MKRAMFLLAIGLPCVLTTSGWAQEEGDRPRRDGEMREEMIKEFDADGDGKLSDDERQTARETMRERRGDRPEGRRRPGQGRGPGGEGRPAPPDPNLLFDEFDADQDGQLSRDEFMKLTAAHRERRGPRPPREGRPDGPPRGEGDDRPGPPPRDRDFGPRPPLENQIDGPPGPPREGEFGPPPGPRGPEGRGPRPGGPGGRGPEGWGGPDPNQIFDRFDENGDDQLSREEFIEMTDRLREMRERFGQGGPGGRGPRGGEGFGGPRRGGPEGGRPPRPQRPDAELGVESEAPVDDA